MIIEKIPYVLIGVLLTVILFMIFKPSQNTIIDTAHYDKKIEILEKRIKVKETMIDSLNLKIQDRTLKITDYKSKLGKLQNKYIKEKQDYEKDINRINSMSNSDIAREFTDTFKRYNMRSTL
jgi:uncharacterized coiled-coil protein SlyX